MISDSCKRAGTWWRRDARGTQMSLELVEQGDGRDRGYRARLPPSHHALMGGQEHPQVRLVPVATRTEFGRWMLDAVV